jgi:hypothetical protein
MGNFQQKSSHPMAYQPLASAPSLGSLNLSKREGYQPPHRPPFSVNHGIFSPAGKKQTHFQQPLSEARKF